MGKSALRFEKAAIIGVGLIGGSLAMVLREKGVAGRITGVGRGIANLEAAKRLGVIDDFTQDPAEGVKGADLVFVSVPVLKIAETVRKAAPSLKPGCIVTDAGSVKGSVVRDVEPLMPKGVSFVAGHPIAGTEHSGVEAALPGLFRGRVCILTLTGKTDPEAVQKVKTMWEIAGAKVVLTDAGTHDKMLAAISHLPHMIAYTLVNTVGDEARSCKELLGYSAGGFRDFTRIASSSPEMWAEICAMNKAHITDMICAFQSKLEILKRLIQEADTEGLKKEFESAKRLRDSLLD
jgi:prephenate dehydrogenase